MIFVAEAIIIISLCQFIYNTVVSQSPAGVGNRPYDDYFNYYLFKIQVLLKQPLCALTTLTAE